MFFATTNEMSMLLPKFLCIKTLHQNHTFNNLKQEIDTMQFYKLKNNLNIIIEDKKSESVTVQITVKVGSNDETKGIAGISHFIEHMLFEGTKKRPDARTISAEIENLGAEFNAFTTNERTSYYIKVPKKHLKTALELLSDMLFNSLFDEKKIEKERKVVLKEIDMVMDEPRNYQYILFEKTLFKKHPAKNPVYGTREAVSKISRKDMLHYYETHYLPNNMVISLAGGISSDAKALISNYFGNANPGKLLQRKTIKEPQQKTKLVAVENRKMLSSYMILGYKTVPRSHKDSYALDLIYAVLGKGQSGWAFDEIRNKRGLAYEVRVLHQPNIDYGYFAVTVGTNKKNIPLVEKLLLDLFKKLQKLPKNEFDAAKTYIEGKYLLDKEDTHDLAEELTLWYLVSKAADAKNYLKNIRKVTLKEARDAAKKYLNNAYTLTILKQK